MTKRELEQLTLLNKEIGRDLERLHELHAVHRLSADCRISAY